MLRITRRPGERIVFGEDVFVEVLEVSGQTVRLGIDAPRSVRVLREELWLEVRSENQAAAAGTEAQLPPLPAGLSPSAEASRPASRPS